MYLLYSFDVISTPLILLLWKDIVPAPAIDSLSISWSTVLYRSSVILNGLKKLLLSKKLGTNLKSLSDLIDVRSLPQ